MSTQEQNTPPALETEVIECFVEMTAIMNNMVRFYDEGNQKGIAMLIDRGYPLSLKAWGLVHELDKHPKYQRP